MSKPGPETRLVAKMRSAATKHYGSRLVIVKYHGNEYSQSGVSDLLCCLDGVFVACEVKAPESYGGSIDRALEKGPTLLQRDFVREITEAGGVGGFAASVDGFLALLAEAEWVSRN